MDRNEIDPTQATCARLNRRAFVGIAAAAGTLAAPALGQASQAMGKTHAPLVPEDDAAIVVERAVLTGEGGAEIPAYAAWPRDARAGTPSVVVTMHVWGVDTSIRDVVRRLAAAGFASIAPDLYARQHAPSGDGVSDISVFRPYSKNLQRSQMSSDLGTGARWIQTRFAPSKTGIVGFCMGGRIAMLASIDDRGVFAAVCPFYGPVEGVDPHAIDVPLCGSYGARDGGIPAASVRAFAAELTVPHEVKIYDQAGHAFMDDQRSAYVASAAADAWQRAVAFLKKYTAA